MHFGMLPKTKSPAIFYRTPKHLPYGVDTEWFWQAYAVRMFWAAASHHRTGICQNICQNICKNNTTAIRGNCFGMI